MRSHLRSFLLTSALSFIPSLASATTISGLYVDGGAGYNLVQDQHVHANMPATNIPKVGELPGYALPKFSVNHSTGFTGFGAVGWGFGNGLRVEAEGLYNFSHDNYTDYANNYPAYELPKGAIAVSCSSVLPEGYKTVQDFWNKTQNAGVDAIPTPQSIMSGKYLPNKCYEVPSSTMYGPDPNANGGNGNGLYEWANTTWPIDKPYLPGVVPANPDPGTYVVQNQTMQPSNGYGGGSNTMFQQVNGVNALNHRGTDESYGGFANVIYDFDLERLFGVKSIVTPFIGGGAGYLWQRYNRPNTMIGAITGTHGGFAWQGIIGAAFDTGIRGLQITAQYRMIGQPGSFYNGGFAYNAGGGAIGNANFDQRFNHQFIVGFRYAFQNRPVHITPPSVSRAFATSTAAAPAPVPARSYLVFFDWNQYALTSRARQIVVEAAHASTYVHTTRINVNGYTDSSAAPGPAGQKYNYALSVKRARSVEAELIRNGVPASEIVIRGYGDTNPLVPTAPNTREPQNRRVEIILHA